MKSHSFYTIEGNYRTVISTGNTKLGHLVNISLPPIQTCIKHAPCAKHCYALQSWNMFPTVRSAWGDNLSCLTNKPEHYWHTIDKYLESHDIRYFRIHVSGDLRIQSDIDSWYQIAKNHPCVKFLIFTKRYYFDYKPIDNVSMIFSAWPGLQLPDWYDKNNPNILIPGVNGIAWLYDTRIIDGRIPEQSTLCRGHCETCMLCFDIDALQCPHVVFNIH